MACSDAVCDQLPEAGQTEISRLIHDQDDRDLLRNLAAARSPAADHPTSPFAAGHLPSIPREYRIAGPASCPVPNEAGPFGTYALLSFAATVGAWERQLNPPGSLLLEDVMLILRSGPGTGNGTWTT